MIPTTYCFVCNFRWPTLYMYMYMYMYVCISKLKLTCRYWTTRPQKSNRNQIWAILIRPTFPFFSGPKLELLCESCLGLLSLLCGIILCEPHCQSRFWNPTPPPVRLKFSGFFSRCLCFPCCKATTTGEEGCTVFRGHRGSLAKMRAWPVTNLIFRFYASACLNG